MTSAISKLSKRFLLASASVGGMLLAACAGDISPDNPVSGVGGLEDEACSAITIEALEDKSAFRVEANASAEATWVFFDMDNGMEVDENDSSHVWDIAFQRFLVRSNGGEGGPDTVAVAYTQGSNVTFANTGVPSDDGTTDGSGNFRQDEEDPDPDAGSNDGNGHVLNSYPVDPEYGVNEAVVNGWPVYDDSTHRLSPRPDTIFTVRSSAGEYYKVEFLAYYSSNHGGAGYPQLIYANHADGWTTDDIPLSVSGCGDEVEIPTVDVQQEGEIYTVQVNASGDAEWIYLNLASREHVLFTEAESPDTSMAWDMAFMRTDVKLNGGSSGPGNAGAHDLLNGTFGERTEAPMEGDIEIPDGGLIPIPTTVEFHQDDGNLAMTNEPPRSLADDDGDLLGDFGWYHYAGFSSGFLDHTITPRSVTYVIRGADGASYYEVEFFQYYLNLEGQDIADYVAFRLREL